MKVLCIADHVDPFIYSAGIKSRFKDVDLVLSAGDLALEYYDYIVSSLNKPLYFVFGNHHLADRHRYERRSDPLSAPLMPDWQGGVGATYLEGRVVRAGGLLLAGLGGSIWYNGGEHQYTDFTMFLVDAAPAAGHGLEPAVPGPVARHPRHPRTARTASTTCPTPATRASGCSCGSCGPSVRGTSCTATCTSTTATPPARRATRDTTVLNAYDHTVIELEAGR